MRRVISGFAGFAVLAMLAASVLLIGMSCDRRPSTGDAGADAFIEWAAKNAWVLDTTDSTAGFGDLQPLRGIVGDAYLVCLGESRHDDSSWIRTSNTLRFSEEEDLYNLRNNLSLLLKRFEDRRAEYIGQTGESDYLWAARCVQVAERAIETFEALISGAHTRAGELRDTAMAANVIWLRTNKFPDERAVVWAHNGHITRTEFEMPDLTDGPVTNMGKHLVTRFEDHLVSVALVFGSGEYPGGQNRDPQVFARNGTKYLDGVLDRTGIARFVLDLRLAPASGLVAGWMDRQARLRAQDGDMVLVTRGAYDAVLFVDRATPTFRNSGAIERLGGVRPNR